jgi:hypothetical protein
VAKSRNFLSLIAGLLIAGLLIAGLLMSQGRRAIPRDGVLVEDVS